MSKKFDEVIDTFFKNYQDRGMKKWSGFFLSDHVAAINKEKVKTQATYPKKKGNDPGRDL